MNIVLASDDNYVPLLTISIVSVLENNQNDFEEINVFILNDGITNQNIEKINNRLNKYDCHVSFIKTKNIENLNSKIVSLERDNISSFTTYSRLFISSFSFVLLLLTAFVLVLALFSSTLLVLFVVSQMPIFFI